MDFREGLTSEFTGPARHFAQVRWNDGLATFLGQLHDDETDN